MTATMKLGQLAEFLGATLQGPEELEITGLATLQEAGHGQLSFLANPQYRKYLLDTHAAAVLLRASDAEGFTGNALIVPDPYLAYARISHLFDPKPKAVAGIHPSAVVAADAQVDVSASVGPFAVIESGAVIGANTTIDRGALADTQIGNGVKLDNQIMIAHNVQIGDHTAMAGCAGISGSTKIGKHCMIAGGVGMVGHIEVCDNVFVTGMTMVTRSITDPGAYSSGTAMQTASDWKKSAARIRQLDDMAKRLKQLENRLAAVTPNGEASSDA